MFSELTVEIDIDNFDNPVLALRHLTLYNRHTAWKGYHWHALDHLNHKELIDDLVGNAKAVVPAEQGLSTSERLFRALFGKSVPLLQGAAINRWPAVQAPKIRRKP